MSYHDCSYIVSHINRASPVFPPAILTYAIAIMKVYGLLRQRDGERREERRDDGRVAVDQRNTRWCSDGLEISCDNGEKVRVAFALDCCDREAMGHVARTGMTAEDVRELMVATVGYRYGEMNRVPGPI